MSHHRKGGSSQLFLLVGLVSGMMLVGVLGLALFLRSGSSPSIVALGAPSFVDESATAGVAQVYQGEFEFFVGGGVAVFDCDLDRKPELYVAGGSGPAGLYLNRSEVGGSLRFEAASDPVTDVSGVTGAYPIDIDSDELTDLVVLRRGPNLILRGLGDCRFEPANGLWGIDGGVEWTAAFSATWEPGEALPSLVFGNYLSLEDNDDRDRCADHQLFRPNGDAYGSPTRLTPGWCTLSVLFSDWGRSGSSDLRMTNDRHYYRDGDEQLWDFDPGSEPREYTEGDGWKTMQIWGMGIASQDIDEDGLPEVFLTSQGDNKLQKLVGGGDRPTYGDIALVSGVTAHRPFTGDASLPSTAWHAEFDDVNNDGLIDLFVTKGNVDVQKGFAMDDPNNLLLGQPDGTFVEAAEEAGLVDFSSSRGGAITDLNLDGQLDAVVVERRQQVRLWRNAGPAGGDARWLSIDVEQSGSNSDAVGSVIEVRTDRATASREVTVGGGHAGGASGWDHFGLGSHQSAEIRVTWPDGEVGPWFEVESDHFWIVERGHEPWMWVPEDS